MRQLKLTIAYDGTDFAGWQRQARERTVQAAIEDALAPIAGGDVRITGAGRTDAGVHAAAQVASVALGVSISCADLRRALNATLPGDVRISAVDEAAPGFNARFDAVGKTYRYAIVRADVMPPLLRRFAWHVAPPLDAAAMRDAAARLCGERDFAGFQASGSSVKTTVRTVTASDVTWLSMQHSDASLNPAAAMALPAAAGFAGEIVLYTITGSGFLRHMVRNIVGTLVEIGLGRRRGEDIDMILGAGDRALASPTAPAHGLVLWSVEY